MQQISRKSSQEDCGKEYYDAASFICILIVLTNFPTNNYV